MNPASQQKRTARPLKKILLLTPPLLPGEPKNFWISPPLGLLYIASYLEKQGIPVIVKDTVIEDWDLEMLTKYIEKEQPDIVGITTMINTMNRVMQTSKMIKQISKAQVVLGGPHITTFPEETMAKDPNADFLVIGEGEETLFELITALNSGMPDLSQIKGLVYRQHEKIFRNATRPFIATLDAMPFPARHLIDLNLYDQKGISAGLRVQRRPATSMIISRGCPFSCTFCYKISGKTYRIRTPQSVIEELSLLNNQFGIREVLFLDDNFTLKNEWVIEFCSQILKKRLDITWSCLGRVYPLSLKMLDMMKKAGCLRMDFGIESGSDRLLKLIRKGVTTKEIKTGVRMVNAAGIETTGYFILGLPTETHTEAYETIRFAKDLDLKYAVFSAYSPFPGTELSELSTHTGTVTGDTSIFDKKREVYLPQGWKKGDVDRLLKRAYLEFYFQPKKILQHILEIRDLEIFIQKIKGVYYLFDKRLSKREV